MTVVYDRLGHLRADTLNELHEFARTLGLRRAWFQGRASRFPHYDLTTTNARRRAKAAGAIEISVRDMVRQHQEDQP